MSVVRGYPNAGHFYSNIVKPIKIDLSFSVAAANANGLGITSLKSNGFVRNVFMHTSQTPGANDGYTNPNPLAGYAWVQLKSPFNKYLGALSSIQAPTTGSDIHIASSSVLTAHQPYVITAVGAAVAPHFSVVAVADSSGSLASKYFLSSDQFGNNYVFYFVVSGVGAPPSLTGSLSNYVAIPVAISTNDANTAVGAAIATAMGAVNGTNSWTASNSGHTVTVTGLLTTVNFSPFPQDVNSGVTVSAVTYSSIAAAWQSVGLPAGLTPTAGQSFFATATGSAVISSAATVKAVTVSGSSAIEVIGDPSQSIAPAGVASNGGAWVMVQFLKPSTSAVTSALTMDSYTPAGTITNGTPDTFAGTPAVLTGSIVNSGGATTMVAGNPADGSVVSMSLYFDGSNVTVDGL